MVEYDSMVDTRARDSAKLPSWTAVFVNRDEFMAEMLLMRRFSRFVRPASVTASPVRMMHPHAGVITLVPSTGRSGISMVQTAQEMQSEVLTVLLATIIKPLITTNDLINDFVKYW